MFSLDIDKFNKIMSKAEDISYYKNRITKRHIDDVNEILSIPITTKEDLRSIPALDMITVPKADLYDYHESFGTTGIPVSTWLTENDFNAYVDELDEVSLKINKEDFVLIRFPYSISVPAHIFTELVRRRGGCVIPVSKATKIAPYPRVVNLIKKLDVTILCCMPLEAFIIKAVAENMGVDIKKEFKKLRALYVAGEMLSPARKQRLEYEWGVPVYEFFGTTETGNLATSCEYGNLHCSTNHFHFEILDFESKKPVEANQRGELHITTLSKENFPLIRYGVGDVVEYGGKCKCGNPSPVIRHHGRADNIILHKGHMITQRDLEEQIFSLSSDPAGNFYRIFKKEDKIEIHLESQRYKDADALEEINASIKLEIPFEVTLLPCGHIENISALLEYEAYGKPVYFIKYR
ncbi:MAG TPA: AMP-binding protein [Clostridia bacterium]